MKKFLSLIFSFSLLSTASFSQNNIEGDQLLQLVGKPITDPLFQQLKIQETFYTDAWDDKLTIYIVRTAGQITEIELQNGKKRYGTETRYGVYTKQLPMQLNWNMTEADFTARFNRPVIVSTAMGFNDYLYNGWKIRVFFENTKPVSISFLRSDQSAPVQTPSTIKSEPQGSQNTGTSILKLDVANATVQVNWPALKQLIISCSDLKPYTGTESTDYIGQVYYSTPYKAEGFNRSAIKYYKEKQQWYYEAFYKMGSDSDQVRKTFFALYNALKKTIKENSGDDFILGSSAKKSISESPMNWLAQWTLYSQYKTLPAGLGKVKIAIMLSGMKNSFKNDAMEYTFKIYIFDKDLSFDVFTWDKPL